MKNSDAWIKNGRCVCVCACVHEDALLIPCCVSALRVVILCSLLSVIIISPLHVIVGALLHCAAALREEAPHATCSISILMDDSTMLYLL